MATGAIARSRYTALMSPFVWWSSAIVLVYGLAYGIGTYAAWPRLSGTGQTL